MPLSTWKKHQRRGHATALLRAAAAHLDAVGATHLSSSNEGSGTVQLLDKVFGRSNVKHKHGGSVVSFKEAVRIMDVYYGYTGSEVDLVRRRAKSVRVKAAKGRKSYTRSKPK